MVSFCLLRFAVSLPLRPKCRQMGALEIRFHRRLRRSPDWLQASSLSLRGRLLLPAKQSPPPETMGSPHVTGVASDDCAVLLCTWGSEGARRAQAKTRAISPHSLPGVAPSHPCGITLRFESPDCVYSENPLTPPAHIRGAIPASWGYP